MTLSLRPYVWCALAAGVVPVVPVFAAPVPAPTSPAVSAAAPAPAQNAANAPTRGVANAEIQTGQTASPTAPGANAVPKGDVLITSASMPAGDTVSQPLGVERAVAIGLARNPGISGGAAGVAAAQATYRSLSALPNVTLGLSTVKGTSAAPTLNGTTRDTFVDLGETIDTSGQRRLSARGAKATYRATAAQLEEARIGLEQQIRDAYWGLVASRAQSAIARESLADAQKINDATHTQQTVGVSPQVDVLRSNIDLANARQSLTGAQGDEAAALAALNVLLVRSPNATLELADTLDENGAEPAPLAELPPLAQVTAQAMNNRPAVVAAREQEQAAVFAVKGARAARLPDISVDYERSVQDPIASLVIGASLPLFDFGSIGQSVRAARAGQQQAAALREQTRAQVAQQVEQSYRDLIQAQKLATSYRTDILEPSKTLLSMAQLGLQQGATGMLPVLDAESTLRAARTGYIANLLSLMKARDELIAATAASATAASATAASATAAGATPTGATAAPAPATAPLPAPAPVPAP